MLQLRPVTLAALVIVAVGFRLMPYLLHALGVPLDPENTAYLWNFSPILPLCVFGAACYARRSLAYLAPVAMYLAGDLGIWLVTGRADWAFYAEQPVTYLAVALAVSCGFIARPQRSWQRIAAAGLGSAALFFAVSNLGTWALGAGVSYPLTWAGLVECYAMAIPFFRNTLVSMGVFLPLLFSPLALRKRPPAAAGWPGGRGSGRRAERARGAGQRGQLLPD